MPSQNTSSFDPRRLAPDHAWLPYEERKLLTEAEVQQSFRKLLKTWSQDPTVFDRLESLLDNLRPESPLRHRLESELEEVRRLQESQA